LSLKVTLDKGMYCIDLAAIIRLLKWSPI